MFQCENNILLNFKACYTPADLHKWRFILLIITKLVRSLKNRASYIIIILFYFFFNQMNAKVLQSTQRAKDERVKKMPAHSSRVEKCARFRRKCLIKLSVNACSLKHRAMLTTKSH